VNDDIGRYFQTKKGLRQGDHLSPIPFNLVANMCAILISMEKGQAQITSLVTHLIEDGLSILQYTDDTILFMEHNLEQAKNMKLFLCAFKQLFGLKINFHKSELFCYGEEENLNSNTDKYLDVRHKNTHCNTPCYRNLITVNRSLFNL
jgi:hypothetical protein